MEKNLSRPKKVKILVTIVDRGIGQKVTKICNEMHLHFHYIIFGKGTASSEILDVLGIGTPEKDVVLSMAPVDRLKHIMPLLSERLKLYKPGRGIAFSMPMSGISGIISQLLNHEMDIASEGEVEKMESNTKYDLVISIVNSGYTDELMEAARSAGATGGTLLHARGIGYEEAEKFLGISIQAEKEIVTILSPRDKTQAIMQAICNQCGVKTKARGAVLSLPVSHVTGLADS